MTTSSNQLSEAMKTAKTWLEDSFDQDTREKVKDLIDQADTTPEPLIDAFYRKLAFGTGGLRGKMGVGTNRINRYTLGLITQGLANYANHNFKENIKVVIAYDTRNNSQVYAQQTAEIFAANGIIPYIFTEARPTPQLSFAIRKLKCQLGIVITASHNPKEYNGYKVYFEDGGQICPPWDKKIMESIEQVKSFDEIKSVVMTEIISVGRELDEAYYAAIKDTLFYPDEIASYPNTGFVYSALHGTGVFSVVPCLKSLGFNGLQVVEEQNIPSGDFPTVVSPNPEERAALELGVKQLEANNLKLLLATDPDSDRIGMVVREEGELHYLSGNQIGVLIAKYILTEQKKKGKVTEKSGYIARTIVTSALIDAIASEYGVKVYTVLTGFKYIGELIRLKETEEYIFGMEESYGYLNHDKGRDKDAVSAATILVEMFYQLEKRGSSFVKELENLYQKHGYFLDHLISVTKEGFSGAEEIKNLMKNYRTNPPKEVGDIVVKEVRDYLKEVNGLPKADVIQIELVDDSIITVRPSGTEPKIKYYFNLKETNADLDEAKKTAQAKLDKLVANFK